MKEGIHPKYFDVEARCACGATWKTRSTKPELHLEICSNCHPFFTGKQKLLDTEGRVERFTKKFGAQTSESRKARQSRQGHDEETSRSPPGRLAMYVGTSSARRSRTKRPARQRSGDGRAATSRIARIRQQTGPDRRSIFRSIRASRCRTASTCAGRAGSSRSAARTRARCQIAHAVLVVNRERFARLRAQTSRGHPRTSSSCAPACRRLVVLTRAAPPSASARSASTADPSAARPFGTQAPRPGGRPPRAAVLEARARVEVRRAPALRARLLRAASGPSDQMQQARRQAGERQQIEPVVLEHGGQRPRVAGAEELEVARRNLEARARRRYAPRAENLLARAPSSDSSHTLRQSLVAPQKRRAGCSTSTCGTPAPATRAGETGSAFRAPARRTTCR